MFLPKKNLQHRKEKSTNDTITSTKKAWEKRRAAEAGIVADSDPPASDLIQAIHAGDAVMLTEILKRRITERIKYHESCIAELKTLIEGGN